MRLTFKKHPKTTGLAHVAHPWEDTDVKADGRVVGLITRSRNDWDWLVRLQVEKDGRVPDDGNPNCSWVWITFKARFTEEPEARAWLVDRWPTLLTKYTLKKED